MESLTDTTWDAVISGTGLLQSLLALALSRSGKNIMHVDANGYYGGSEAAFSLQEIEEWAQKHAASDGSRLFSGAETSGETSKLSSRAYSIALAPQLIHAKSKLVTQLVSSKAFRQIEFVAVGSFFICQPSDEATPASLNRIPSTREDVFANTTIPAKAKRSLMKFLKFVLDWEAEAKVEVWSPHKGETLSSFLESEFKLDGSLQSYVVTLTLSMDKDISVEHGLSAISKHLRSMGHFGAGFAAVYPKWGGLSEVAQVGCRALAVGGGVYMLGTGVDEVTKGDPASDALNVSLVDNVTVKAKHIVLGSEQPRVGGQSISRLTALVDSSLTTAFQAATEYAPTPAVAVVAFPPGTLHGLDGTDFEHPVYAMLHSKDTGECPDGQCLVYFSTVSTTSSRCALKEALSSLLQATQSASPVEPVNILYQLVYDQSEGQSSMLTDGKTITLPAAPLTLAFNDECLESVQKAWALLLDIDDTASTEYLNFEDREGVTDEDNEVYD